MNVACPECRSVFRVDPAKITSASLRARCSVCGGIIAVGASVRWADDLATLAGTSAQRSALEVARAGAATPSVVATRTVSGAAAAVPLPRLTTTDPAPATVAPAQSPSGGRRLTPPFSAPAVAAPTPPRAQPVVVSHAPASSTVSSTTPVQAPAPPQIHPSNPTPPTHLTPARPSIVRAPETSPPSSRPPTPAFGAPLSPPPRDGAATQRRPINPFLANDPNQKARRLARALVSDMIAYHPAKREEGLRNGTLKQLFREEIKKSYEEYVEQVGRDFADTSGHFQDALNDVLAGGRKIF